MTSVGKVTRQPPEGRQKSLLKFLESVRTTPEAKQVLDEWGLELESATIEMEVRSK